VIRGRVSFEEGLPPAVVAAADATVALGGGVVRHARGRVLLEVRFCRPAGYALELLTGLRGCLCAGPDEWVWTPDRANDVALGHAPFSELLQLRRAS
jgi:hypothetical protein